MYLHHGISYTSTTSLYVVAKLGVADVIKDGAIDYNEIAAQVGAVPDKLFRIMRYLSTEGIFSISGTKVSLTAEGQLLRSDREGSMRWCMIHWNEEAAESMHALHTEVVSGQEAFLNTHGKGIFSLYEERPTSAEAFTKCMKGLFFEMMPAVTAEYDFSQHHTLLDLGGGMGLATMAILKTHYKDAKPSSKLTKAIVFDLDKVIKHSDQKHEILTHASGSFFDLRTVPSGADAILINGVLHDWNKDECIALLTNAGKALEPGGRIIVVDFAIPGDKSHPLYNAATRMDVFMMTISSGHYRTFKEYDEIWPEANLKLVETRRTRSLNSIWILQKL